MQDQLMGGGTNLQQPRTDLQQGTPNLQQTGTSTSTTDVTGVLSENAPSGSLRVSTATSPGSKIQPDAAVNHGGSHGLLLLLLILPVLLLTAVLWPRTSTIVVVEPEPTPEGPKATPAPVKKTTKPKKKSQKRKKSGRR